LYERSGVDGVQLYVSRADEHADEHGNAELDADAYLDTHGDGNPDGHGDAELDTHAYLDTYTDEHADAHGNTDTDQHITVHTHGNDPHQWGPDRQPAGRGKLPGQRHPLRQWRCHCDV
jgi:hypothetical protein